MNISAHGEILLADLKYVDPLVGAKRLRPGDVLFNNTNSPKWVGKTAFVRSPGEWAFSNHMTRLSVPSSVDGAFLAAQLHAMQQEGIFEQICSNHVNQASVSTSRLLGVSIKLPPFAEQRRIVDVLEDHLSRLDAADAGLDAAEQRLGGLRDSMTLKFISACDGEVALGTIASVGTGSTPSRSNPSYYLNGTVPWLTSGDLVQGGEARPTRKVTEDAVRDARLRVYPSGTLVMAMYGEGKTRGTVAELAVDSTMNQACAGIQVRGDEFDRAWVKLALVSSYRRMRARASGGVQPNLNLAIVRSTGVPAASREVKMRAVREIQEVGNAAGRLSGEIVSGRARSAVLHRAVLSAAFSGQLTGSASDSDRIEELADAPHDPR